MIVAEAVAEAVEVVVVVTCDEGRKSTRSYRVVDVSNDQRHVVAVAFVLLAVGVRMIKRQFVCHTLCYACVYQAEEEKREN